MATLNIAVLSDIHGNLLALETVLADIAAHGGADAFWVLGDLAAMGYAPIAVLERLKQLPNAHFIRGNTDRYIASNERPASTLPAASPPEQVQITVEVAQSLSWTQGAVWAAGWREWLAALPLEFRETLPNGTRVLAVHASPGTDDGIGLRPHTPDADAAPLFLSEANAEADLVLVGHTHWPQDRALNGVRVVNVGSVGLPFTPESHASYALLRADEQTYSLELRSLEFDREAVIAQLAAQRHPAQALITGLLRGTHLPPWVRG
ncbi:MAG: metallophosphoesterase family protein [Anaerolineales bacterium]|nr:metallophosphoesterase family protein [Anaerolineales bacterium]